MSTLTPREIVAELDKFVVGQEQAKRMVAVAVRNRWRRQHLPEELRDEVAPKNIIMMGPTGVGKTEIARRLAKLSGAPFIKVEATKFTEVGYVGRDVESMVRDLMEIGINPCAGKRKMPGSGPLPKLPPSPVCWICCCPIPLAGTATIPAKNCASSSALASWTTAKWKSK